MTALTKKRKYTPNEYLALEEKAEYRSEFVDGYIFKMAGSTESHIQISFNLTRLFSDALRGKCRAYQSEMKVWVDEFRTYFYPDVTVVCGARKFHRDKRDIVENPVLLVEVLSEGTKEYDKNDKFFTYQKIPSFQEYVLISQNQPAVQQYLRQPDDTWKYKATIGIGSRVIFDSVNAEFLMEDIYDLVEFESK